MHSSDLKRDAFVCVHSFVRHNEPEKQDEPELQFIYHRLWKEWISVCSFVSVRPYWVCTYICRLSRVPPSFVCSFVGLVFNSFRCYDPLAFFTCTTRFRRFSLYCYFCYCPVPSFVVLVVFLLSSCDICCFMLFHYFGLSQSDQNKRNGKQTAPVILGCKLNACHQCLW